MYDTKQLSTFAIFVRDSSSTDAVDIRMAVGVVGVTSL